MHAVTIAAQNYLPFARLLARSFHEHNPKSEFVILVVDALPGEVPDADGYTVATPADLPMDSDEFRRMAMIYDVTELSTSLKPWALEMLLSHGADVAMYLDPDIVVYDDLGEIDRLSQRHGIVLTPHTLSPMRRDGLRPSEADIMGSGIYNLGFIAVGPGGLDMLRWWQERLLRDSISAPERDLFTDQRWIDFVPSFFDHTILRDPGYNVAYWNLDSRTLSREGDHVLVEGRPLRFFHFSGYRPETPWVLSKYVADRPRVLLSEQPVVRELCEQYGAAALAEGITQWARVPYHYRELSNGVRVTRALRRTYRLALIEAERTGSELPPAPFTPEGDDALLAWFREPMQPGHPMNRAVHGAWQVRGDLQAAFPQPLGADEERLLAWARVSGVAEGELVVEVLPDAAARAPQHRLVRVETPGVNVTGYLTAELGVGQFGRLVVDAVRASGLPFATTTWTRTESRLRATFEDVGSGGRYPVNLAVVNADQIPTWVEEFGADQLEGRYTIGAWAWEVEEFPATFQDALGLVDEVWAISGFTRDAIARVTDKPVHVFPNPVLPIEAPMPLDRAALGLPEGPMFLFVFDYLSVFERKNPLALVEAFCSAFEESEAPILVIKTINGDRRRTDRERLRAACADRRGIFLIEDYLESDVVTSLVANATCYVSLHRSEGYGLTMAEAMVLGVPVIATGYSGNLDFMTDDDSLLVPYELVPVAPGSGPYPVTTRWAEPDVDAAARLMRKVNDDPAFAADLGRRGQSAVLDVGRLDHAVEFVRGRVAYAMKHKDTVPAKVPSAAAVSSPQGAVARARAMIRTPLDTATPSRMPSGVARNLRKAVDRLLTHHDQEVNVRLEALADAIAVTAAESERVRGQLLAATQSALDQTDTRLNGHEDMFADVSGRLNGHEDMFADVSGRLNGHEDIFADVSGRLDATTARTQTLETELIARPYMTDPDQLLQIDADGRQHLALSPANSEASYAGFEDVFRGSEAFIADRLEPYLGLLKDKAPVLDVGCGRGELLDLLAAIGVKASGVDLDASMLERCTAKGLDVRLGDAVAVLNATEEDSLGAVTSFQVVEHVELAELRAMFEASYRALRSGGVMVAETVNPHSPPALKTFWLDLTHIRPLYPEALLFLARETGFTEARIVFPLGSGVLDEDLRRCGEYAIVASKA